MLSSSTRTALDYETFKAVRRERSAAYRLAHPDRVKADLERSRARHPDRPNTGNAWRLAHPVESAWSRYKSKAKTRGLVFDLTREVFDALILAACSYCGVAPNPVNGIDRVDNGRGYLTANVVSCCMPCNRMKMHRTRAEFLAQVERIHHFQSR